MAANDVAIALMAIEDEAICTSVAKGDTSGIGDARLSAEEGSMIQEAAAELGSEVQAYDQSSALIRASVYAAQGPLNDLTRTSFDGFLRARFGGDIATLRGHNWAYA